jgi:hypothetical protein
LADLFAVCFGCDLHYSLPHHLRNHSTHSCSETVRRRVDPGGCLLVKTRFHKNDMALNFLLLVATTVSAFLPGIPPQCFDEYQCVFYRFNISGAEYVWDLRSLCA